MYNMYIRKYTNDYFLNKFSRWFGTKMKQIRNGFEENEFHSNGTLL